MYRQILTVGLSKEVNEVFATFFALDRMQIITCPDMNEAMGCLDKRGYRLIIYNASDLSPDEAQEIVSRIRRETYAPLIVLTADEAAAATQEAGADVCVPPDMDLHRLFSTAMGQIRRNECYSQYDKVQPRTIVLYRGDLTIDSSRHRITRAGEEIRLLPQEFRLLAFMARNAGIVLSAEQISPAIWLDDNHSARDAARVIFALRRKLGDDIQQPRYIQTVHGVGYRFLPLQ